MSNEIMLDLEAHPFEVWSGEEFLGRFTNLRAAVAGALHQRLPAIRTPAGSFDAQDIRRLAVEMGIK